MANHQLRSARRGWGYGFCQGCEPHPSGHPEGYLEAFAQLYTDLAEQIRARLAGREAAAASLLVPGVEDGVAGVRFIDGVLESSRGNSVWLKIPTH